MKSRCFLSDLLCLFALLLPALVTAEAETNEPAEWKNFLGLTTMYPSTQQEGSRLVPTGYTLAGEVHLGRHGSRQGIYPNELAELRQSAHDLFKKGTSTPAGAKLLQQIDNYYEWHEKTNALGRLTYEGVMEQFHLGARMAMRFMDHLEGNTPVRVRAINSGLKRTQESQAAFIFGVTGAFAVAQERAVHTYNIHTHKDLKATNPHTYYNYRPLHDVTKAIGKVLASQQWSEPPQSLYDFAATVVSGLNEEDARQLVKTMAQLCRLDSPQDMKWELCAPFETFSKTENSVGLFSFLYDITRIFEFYAAGPAVEKKGAVFALGLPILDSFLSAAQEIVEEPETAPHMNLRFSHDSSLISFMTTLGLIKAEGNNKERMETFSMKELSPMSANIVWQVWRKGYDVQVVMLHNEQPVNFPIPECAEAFMCQWDIVREHYSQEKYQLSQLPQTLSLLKGQD
ncbi:histidine phosphatase family protein [Sansalvadorimonas verongulae]|uniref:histidine phosphatase family protein n=1 Tax=Sansalvadorimonas verongulae TaxID=2172824 RepID=UPI0012BBF589|nr:histidine phosphatase family protein [Sansalvadorimonas verongulae]MTI15327.1 histidine-type phosphatase [Sansalvadorimonas verongulae]